jgi:hypothetical protein
MQITPLIVDSIFVLLSFFNVPECAIYGVDIGDGVQRYFQLTAQALDRESTRKLFAVDDFVCVPECQASTLVDLEVRLAKLGDPDPEERRPVRGRSDQVLSHGPVPRRLRESLMRFRTPPPCRQRQIRKTRW